MKIKINYFAAMLLAMFAGGGIGAQGAEQPKQATSHTIEYNQKFLGAHGLDAVSYTHLASKREESFGDGIPHEGMYTRQELKDLEMCIRDSAIPVPRAWLEAAASVPPLTDVPPE